MTVKAVVVLEDVVIDLNHGKQFYDYKNLGVGDYFWDSLLSDIESLKVYGGIHSQHYGLYRMLAKRFPYAIYYNVKDEVVHVMAVLPMRRDPVWLEKELEER